MATRLCPVFGGECVEGCWAGTPLSSAEAGSTSRPTSPPVPVILALFFGPFPLIFSPIDPFGDELFRVPAGPDAFWDEPLLV